MGNPQTTGGAGERDRVVPDVSDFGGLAVLIEQAQRGSAEALNELLASLRGYLLLVANQELDSRVRAKVGASDLVQSALVRVERNLGRFEGSRPALLGWVRKILRNEIHATHRKFLETEKRDARREVAVGAGSHLGPVIADNHPSPGTEAILHEEAVALRRALGRLPDDYRTVVMLRNWERLPFDQIGERMCRSTDAAKKLWSRAVQQLQKELDHEASR